MNKFKKSLFVVLGATLGVVTLSACGDSGGSTTSSSSSSSEPAPEPVPPEPTPTPDPWYVISEKGMDSFVTKIQKGGYRVDGGQKVTEVKSRDMVTFYFRSGPGKTNGVFTTPEGETFVGFAVDDPNATPAKLAFYDKKDAMDCAYPYLPTFFISKVASGGNIWTLFHNTDQNHPLRYTSTSYAVKVGIAAFADFGTTIADTIDNIVLEFDDVDVKTAHLTGTYSPSTGVTNKFDIVMSFEVDDIKTDPSIVNWVNNEDREYPANIGDLGSWPDSIQVMTDSLFDVRGDSKPLPYGTNFSYAVYMNNYQYDQFLKEGYILIHDYHATEKELKQYKQTLKDAGYEMAEGKKELVFRSPFLRESAYNPGFKVFSDISLTLDDGLIIKVTKYYNPVEVTGLSAINTYIAPKANGQFVNLPEDPSGNITAMVGEDSPYCATEDMSNLPDYRLAMEIDLEYTSEANLKTYVKGYTDTLLANGYTYEDDADQYYIVEPVKGRTTFDVYRRNNKAIFYFRHQFYVNPTDAHSIIFDDDKGNFPGDLDFTNLKSARETKEYEKFQFGMDYAHFYWLTFKFATHQDMINYISDYIAVATADPAFKKINWQNRVCGFIDADVDDPTESNRIIIVDYTKTGTDLNMWFAMDKQS